MKVLLKRNEENYYYYYWLLLMWLDNWLDIDINESNDYSVLMKKYQWPWIMWIIIDEIWKIIILLWCNINNEDRSNIEVLM